MTSANPQNEPKTSWPYGSILFWGTFGTQTEAGRRYRWRGMLALLAFVAIHAAANWVPRAYHDWFWPVTGLGFSYISWEWWRYLRSLDELERKLQMEAAAWTYVFGIAAAAALGGIYMTLQWRINPGWLFFFEVLRTRRLYKITRWFE